MKDIILDTLFDGLKLIPFLFVAFIIIECIEHKLSNKSKKIVSKSGKFGPLIGSLLGLLPQCGFSVVATNLYITRIISLGTLIAIYMSTSDEMLPILISNKVEGSLIIKILLIKFVIGMIYGFIIDLFLRNKKDKRKNIDLCEEDDCHCEEEGIIYSSFVHTIKTFVFILIISFIINIVFEYYGEEFLSKLLLKDTLFGPLLSSLIGLIPNCGASVMITQLYVENCISFGTMISGLLTSSGVAILVLFRSNKDIKENVKILVLSYVLGAISGIVIELISMFI